MACMNAGQPRSRQAVLDRVVEVPSPRADPPPAPAPEPPRAHKKDVADVEVVPVPHAKVGRARATVLVRAPADAVRAVLFDFPNYPAFLPHYKSATVELVRQDGSKRVHMEIDALGGLLHRWMRVDISSPVVSNGRESFDAKLVEGDVRAFEARWVLEPVAEGTKLTLESFLDPKLELPAAFLDAGSASGLKDSILAVKARAEESVK